jgi:cytochrome b
MNTPSASRVDTTVPETGSTPPTRKVLIWDAPVRVFHWLMVLSFAGAYLTAESERWRLVHVTLGYTMAGLVAFRVLWGVVGTRHARFSSFVRGPAAIARYLRSLVDGRPEHHAGHNPAGALAIIALLGMTMVVTAAGWATYNEVGGGWLEELHEGAANVMLSIVAVHVAAVLLASWLHRSNLIGAMVTGRRTGNLQEGVRSAWRSIALLMLIAVMGFWWAQWDGAAAAGVAGITATAPEDHGRDDD